MNFKLGKEISPFMLCLCFVAQTSLKTIWLQKQKEEKKRKKKRKGREVCSASNVQTEIETKRSENYQIKLTINAIHFQSRFHAKPRNDQALYFEPPTIPHTPHTQSLYLQSRSKFPKLNTKSQIC